MIGSPRRRQTLFALVLVALLLVGAELVLWAAGPTLYRTAGIDMQRVATVLEDQTERLGTLLYSDETMIALDSTLGWRYRPGYASAVTAINSAGMRGRREYPVQRADSGLRVAAFGDSFIHGTEVNVDEVWSGVLERRHEHVEVLNYGVGGYGTDQAFLMFLREGSVYAPDVVLIGFAPVNLRRAVNVYRRFISTDESPLVKPRFRLGADGALALIPNPLPDRGSWEQLHREPARLIALGEHDVWYDRIRYENPVYDWSATVRFSTALWLRIWRKYLWKDRLLAAGRFRPEAPAFALQRRLLLDFADSVRAAGAQPVVVIFPDFDSIESARAGGHTVYAPLLDSLVADARAPVFDLVEAFLEDPEPLPLRFAPGGHYSASGNALVAEWLGARLLELHGPSMASDSAARAPR